MWALLMAEQMRLTNSIGSATEKTALSTEAECSSKQSTRPAGKGTTHASKQQSASPGKDPALSLDKEGAWQQCLEHAQEAVNAWQCCLTDAVPEAVASCEGLVDTDVLPQLMLGLLFMAGVHGEALSLGPPHPVCLHWNNAVF